MFYQHFSVCLFAALCKNYSQFSENSVERWHLGPQKIQLDLGDNLNHVKLGLHSHLGGGTIMFCMAEYVLSRNCLIVTV